MVADLVAVIIAGGSGKRFWPLSDSRRPKQFLKLFGDRTMLQMTFDRLDGLVPPERILIVTGERFVPLVREQLPNLPAGNVIGEPVSRDTAAAIGLGAVVCHRRFGNPVMLVLPADHLIQPVDAFHTCVASAFTGALESGKLYTFGIIPTYPATGYGYLELGPVIREVNGIEHFRVEQFAEKPDAETARTYLNSGRFCWNSGMFVWTVDSIMNEFKRHLPDHSARLLPLGAVYGTERWKDALEAAFEPLPRISIDYGIMEKAGEICAVRAQFEWSDVGGWEAVARYLETDASGNVLRGKCEVLDSTDNLVFCEEDAETIALVGVDNLVIVRAGDKTLVADRNRTEDIKRLVEEARLT